jgi:hypothetical protein
MPAVIAFGCAEMRPSIATRSALKVTNVNEHEFHRNRTTLETDEVRAGARRAGAPRAPRETLTSH